MKQRAFTLIELLIAITIIAILSTLLMVVAGMVRFQARNAVCSSQLHQWGLALMADAADHRGRWSSDSISGGCSHNAHDFSINAYDRLIADYGMPTRIMACPHAFTYTKITDYEAWAESCRGYGIALLGYSYWVQRSDDVGTFPPAPVACPSRIGIDNPNGVPLMSDSFVRQIGVDPLYGGHLQRADCPRRSNELFTDGHVGAVTNSSEIVWRYNGNGGWENWR